LINLNSKNNQYSEDRLSLALEIAETLKTRGYWVPKEYAGPDLILAIAMALDSKDSTGSGFLKSLRKDNQ
jgi:hypothetical protein